MYDDHPFGARKVHSNNRLRWIVAVAPAFALAVLLAWFLGRGSETDGEVSRNSAGNEAAAAQEETNVAQDQTIEQTGSVQGPRASDSAPVEAVAAGEIDAGSPGQSLGAPDSSLENAWRIVNPGSVNELPPYKEVVPGRVLVRVSEALRLGMGGDRIALAVPQLGTTFEGVVERFETDSYGNVSYIGLLTEADGRNYRFIITAGAHNTFAHIGTSHGSYELVANSELGWLMPTAGMDQHVDYSQLDYILPEEPPILGDQQITGRH